MLFYIIKLFLFLLLIRKPIGFFLTPSLHQWRGSCIFFILRSISTVDNTFEFPNIEIILVFLE